MRIIDIKEAQQKRLDEKASEAYNESKGALTGGEYAYKYGYLLSRASIDLSEAINCLEEIASKSDNDAEISRINEVIDKLK